MKLKPVLTEKSLSDAKNGKYTFWVTKSASKHAIRQLVKEIFGFKTEEIKTINYKKSVHKNLRGRMVSKPARKKTIITLKGKDKIDIFETKK